MRGTYEVGHYRENPARSIVLEIQDERITVVERTSAGAVDDAPTVTAPVAALADIVPYAERRLGLTGTGPDLVSRFVACLTELAGRDERVVSTITALHDDRLGQVADWYTDLGISHEETKRHGGGRIRRVVLLRVRPEPSEYRRTLYLDIEPDRLLFHESYQRGDDQATLHTVEMPPADVPHVPRPAGRDAGDRVAAEFTALVAGGELGAHLPFRENRDRVHRRYAEAGVKCRRSGTVRWHHLTAEGVNPALAVDVTTLDDSPTIEFRQLLFHRGAETETSTVRSPLSSLGGLVTFLEQRLDRPAGPHTEDELFACFSALVALGELDIARATGLFAEAGVPYVFSGKRKHPLLTTYRESTGCEVSLSLTVETHRRADGSALVGLLFTEYYDYTPRSGDAGREYGYSVEVEPTDADRLIAGLEGRLGTTTTGEPAERLVGCFQALIESGELSGDLPLKENRDRVADVLRRSGKVKTDSSVWFNSD